MPIRTDRRVLQTFKTEKPKRTVEVYESPQLVDTSADGFGRSWSGAQVTKIELFRLLEITDAGDELREVFMHLTVPTPALIEFCLNVINGLGTNLPLIEESAGALRKLISDGIARANTLKL